MTDPISVIEAAYRIEGPIESWLGDIAKLAADAFGSSGAMAFRYDASSGDWTHIVNMTFHGLPPEFPQEFFNHPNLPKDKAMEAAKIFMTCDFDTMHALVSPLGPELPGVLDRFGIGDMVCINATDPTGRGCAIAVADRKRTHAAKTVQTWRRLCAHISAGNRLRRELDEISPPSPDSAEAVFRSDGRVEHAVGPAESRVARAALQNALVRIDRARSRREEPEHAVELWRGLVSGRWSLVEHFETDGKRYYLAHKNDPVLARDRALTAREKQVLGYAELGHSNKLIAYSLGVSVSTVSTLLSKARRKLGEAARSGPILSD